MRKEPPQHRVQREVIGEVEVHVPLPGGAAPGEAAVEVVEAVELAEEHVLQTGAQLDQGDRVGPRTQVGGQQVVLGQTLTLTSQPRHHAHLRCEGAAELPGGGPHAGLHGGPGPGAGRPPRRTGQQRRQRLVLVSRHPDSPETHRAWSLLRLVMILVTENGAENVLI